MGNSDFFAIHVHHGGRFEDIEGSDCYVEGKSDPTFNLDPDKFGYFDAADLVEKFGYVSWAKLWYKIPNADSCRWLKTDLEVMDILAFLNEKTRVLHLYTEGRKIGDGVNETAGNEGANADKFESVNDWGEGVGSDGESEDSDYSLCSSESFDDFEDFELASEDEEYIHSMENVKAKGSVFDNLDHIDDQDLGFNKGYEHVESDYDSYDGDVYSDSTDEEIGGLRFARHKSSYDPKCDHKFLELKLGMRFENSYQMKKALVDYGILNGKFIHFKRVSKDNKLVSSKWIAKRYINVFRPKKLRRKDPEEKDSNKLKRFGHVMTCQNCYKKGHNRATCTNEKVPPPPKGKREKPRKDSSQPPRPQNKKAPATSKSQQKIITRDKRNARKVAGIWMSEETGNTYYHMPRQRVIQVNQSLTSNSTRSNVTYANEGPSTQESSNPGGV